MKFKDLDTKMRQFETTFDQIVLPDTYIILRLDGRGFTKLTKKDLDLKRPFDIRFNERMVETVKFLMTAGARVVYGYTQSDEISLLLAKEDDTFNRKVRKLNSVMAGSASAKFTQLSNALAVFDCRVCQLPSQKLVVDYFRWRQADCTRNALNAYCYWKLRDVEGLSGRAASNELQSMSVSDKNDLLFTKFWINFNDTPLWQRRGVGVTWETVETEGYNPKLKATVTGLRNRLVVNNSLEKGDAYSEYINSLIL